MRVAINLVCSLVKLLNWRILELERKIFGCLKDSNSLEVQSIDLSLCALRKTWRSLWLNCTILEMWMKKTSSTTQN